LWGWAERLQAYDAATMISMQGVPSVLIAKNQSWVRKQAQALVRHLPANVERADLIQVGLIAVAQAAVSFEWEGDRDTPEAQEAFVRYARMRVKGAMLDELRQMDYLSRGERRKIKVIQIARERHRQQHGAEPNYTQLSAATGISADEIGSLMQADQMGRTRSTSMATTTTKAATRATASTRRRHRKKSKRGSTPAS
jgi:RNA polymerase sigma factor for flagellar operon FliA